MDVLGNQLIVSGLQSLLDCSGLIIQEVPRLCSGFGPPQAPPLHQRLSGLTLAASGCSLVGMCSPGGSVVLTVRLVRSFEHRNFRPVVLHGVSPDQSVEAFMGTVRAHICSRADLPLPFRTYDYDTMKIVHQAHGAKTNELVMSLDDDEKLVLRAGQTLREAGVANETEVAFFKKDDYALFKANPKTVW